MSSKSRFLEALESRNVKAVKKIIDKPSFQVNATALPPGSNVQVGFYSVLCAVAESGLVEVAKALLEKEGVQVDAEIGCSGMTALYLAC
jgi:hypothetical protein